MSWFLWSEANLWHWTLCWSGWIELLALQATEHAIRCNACALKIPRFWPHIIALRRVKQCRSKVLNPFLGCSGLSGASRSLHVLSRSLHVSSRSLSKCYCSLFRVRNIKISRKFGVRSLKILTLPPVGFAKTPEVFAKTPEVFANMSHCLASIPQGYVSPMKILAKTPVEDVQQWQKQAKQPPFYAKQWGGDVKLFSGWTTTKRTVKESIDA